MFPVAPDLPDEERDWARAAAPSAVDNPEWADVLRVYGRGHAPRLPWHAPIWDSGEAGVLFVPGLPRRHVAFWDEVILVDHPLRDSLLAYLRDGVNLQDFLIDSHRGPSVQQPYNVASFRQAVFPNRIPSKFVPFVESEVQSLIARGCVAKWSDVKGPAGPVRPRLIMALSVEETKPRLIYDARPLNQFFKRMPFSMDTVARVANVASPGCYMTSLDDSSAFHHILIRPSSWPLLGFEYGGVDYVWCVLPFGLSISPFVYHTLSEAKAAFLRSLGIPALAYLDDSFLTNLECTQGQPAREQWLAACEATHISVLVSYFCGNFLSPKKCDWRPTTVQKYLGMLCDSATATFRVPQDKLDAVHDILQESLAAGNISFRTLQRVAGKVTSMTVAIRPASLYTQAMFAALAALERSTLRSVDLTKDSSADLVGEMRKWLDITATTHEGPWQLARHFTAALTKGASDASSLAWGGVLYAATDPFEAGGMFPPEWMSSHINLKEMYALYHVLLQFCQRHPDRLRRAQVFVDVDNQSVVGAFNRGRAKNRAAHELLIRLFDLQIEYDFLLSLKWVPTADNGVADAISRPSRETIIRLGPDAFRQLWQELGPFNIDLMACTASAQHSPSSGRALPFFSRYHCAGSMGVDVFAQNVAVLPGGHVPAFGFCFPPPVMAGHVVQHLAECRARAVVILPSVKAYWFPRVLSATTRSVEVAGINEGGVFVWPSAEGVLKTWRYPRWAMMAYEVDFR